MQNIFDGPYPTKLAPDRESALAVFKPFGADPTFMVIEGEPRSKARPRFSGGGSSYAADKQDAHERLLKHYMRTLMLNPLRGNVAIACIFYRSSKHRVDVDNLLKQVFDAANGILWHDDMQVTACIGILKMDRTFPRTLVIVGRHLEPSLDRSNQDISAECKQCGKPFIWRTYARSKQVGKFCSVACSNRFGHPDIMALANCRFCAQPFKRRTSAQSICSDECRIEWMRATKKERARPASFCRCCGAPVSRPEYRRCRSCFAAGRTEVAELKT